MGSNQGFSHSFKASPLPTVTKQSTAAPELVDEVDELVQAGLTAAVRGLHVRLKGRRQAAERLQHRRGHVVQSVPNAAEGSRRVLVEIDVTHLDIRPNGPLRGTGPTGVKSETFGQQLYV
jgi:hypothetical protein